MESFKWGNISPETLKIILLPYGERLHLDESSFLDGWGHPMEFGVQCRGPYMRSLSYKDSAKYAIRAANKDGTFDAQVYLDWPTEQDDFNRDTVLACGSFICYMAGCPAPHCIVDIPHKQGRTFP